jgi:Tol biopolymer transport system component
VLAALPRTRWGEGAPAGDVGAWWLEITTNAERYRVRADGSEWHKVGPLTHRGALSPDGQRLVYTDAPQDEKRLFDGEIFVADADGANAQRLTDNDAHDNGPVWSPDGKRIVFESDRGGSMQIYAMDDDGDHIERLTHEVEGAQRPKFASDGRFAYVALRRREGKLWYQDLVVRDGDTARALVKNAWLYADFAWSPDGKTMAYGKIGSIVFHDLASGREEEVDFSQKINREMSSHAAFNLAWRPDGEAVACSIMFLGGRPQGGPKMIGDEEIFVIPRHGRPTWFSQELLRNNSPQSISWVQQQ